MSWVVLAEPWFGGSHRSWAEGLAAHSRHDVTIVSLPPGGWRWRLRAGAHPLAAHITREIRGRGAWPDALIVSGLVDVSSLLGHVRLPGDVPVVAYMHESQLVYPTADGTVDADAALRNWSSWLAADAVWFNSHFHRDAVVGALPAWAASQPEPITSDLVDRIVARFAVLPVGVDRPSGAAVDGATAEGRAGGPNERPTILWPHRWEPDKAPEVFARALDKAIAAGVEFDVVLAGDDPASSPVRSELVDRLGHRVSAVGPFDRAEYESWLVRSDLVVSCARHEFFGVAVVEAMMAGCLPVLPDALSYPEIVPERFHSAALYEPGTFGSRLLTVLSNLESLRSALAGLPDALGKHEWSVVGPRYDRSIDEIVDAGGVVSARC